jgi:DNA-binding response OmpR family regulator
MGLIDSAVTQNQAEDREMRVLLVEDDKPVASFLKKGLEAEHYAVDLAEDGEQAQHLADEYQYDIVVLDIGLPKVDGLEVLKHIRAGKTAVPILMLSSRRQVEDRVLGLDLGADDYLPKPFAFSELAARTRSLLRRSQRSPETNPSFEDLELNRVERTVKRGGKPIDLTPKEFALLEYLLQNAGRCVTRAMIIEHVWNLSFDTMTNVVDVYVNYLRKKVDHGFEPRLIHTVRGVGYQLGAPRSKSEV